MHVYKQKETNCAIETRVVRGTKVVSGLKCVYAGGKEVSEKRRSKGRKTLVEETCCYCVQAGQYTFTCHAADKGPHWKPHTTDLIKITHWVIVLSTSLLSLQWFLKARLCLSVLFPHVALRIEPCCVSEAPLCEENGLYPPDRFLLTFLGGKDRSIVSGTPWCVCCWLFLKEVYISET